MASIGIKKHTAANGRVSFMAEVNLKGYPRQKKAWDTEELAVQWRHETIVNMKKKKQGMYVAPDGTVGELITRYVTDYGNTRGGWSRSKQDQLDKLVEDIGSVPLKDLHKQDIIAYAKKVRASGRGPSGTLERLVYLQKVFNVGFTAYDENTPRDELRSAISVLRDRGIVSKSKERDRQIEEWEITKLKQFLSPVMQDIVDLLMVLPFRIGELCAIRWEDIDEVNRRVRLFRKDTCKDKDDYKRTEWIALPVIEAVRGGKTVAVDTFAAIAKRDRNQYRPFPIRSTDASKQFTFAHNTAGIEDIHLHDTRAEAISNLLNHGFDHVVITELSGHRDLSVLKKHYARMKPKQVHELFERQIKINRQARQA